MRGRGWGSCFALEARTRLRGSRWHRRAGRCAAESAAAADAGSRPGGDVGLDAVGGTRRAAAGVTAGAPGASDASDASGALSRTVRRRGREGISYLARCPLRRPAGPRGGRRRGRPSVRPSERGALRSTSSPRSVSAFAKILCGLASFSARSQAGYPLPRHNWHSTSAVTDSVPRETRLRDASCNGATGASAIAARQAQRPDTDGVVSVHQLCAEQRNRAPWLLRRIPATRTSASALPCCCPTPSRPGRRAR